MSKVYVISDVHGRYEALREALLRARIISENGSRQLARRHQLVSIGDLANCTEDSVEGDLACLGLLGPVIDKLLIGNHEIPYFDPDATFVGFHFDERVNEALHAANENGLVALAQQHNGTLISHAGLDARLLGGYAASDMPKHMAEVLAHIWETHNYHHSFVASVGRGRGGWDQVGGMLWCDFDKELMSGFPQIVGHTPGMLRAKPNALCIDVGAKSNGLPAIIEVS